MSDRPILFSAPMIRALLEGRKTQTRRVLKLPGWAAQPPEFEEDDKGVAAICAETGCFAPLPTPLIGDRLWVREAYRVHRAYDDLKPSELGGDQDVWPELDRDNCDAHGRYRHARFMPRWASRLTLTVKAVRVERLNDCSEEDAIDEGIEARGVGCLWGWIDYLETNPNVTRHFADPRRSYASLWNHINGAGAWEANPWVVAISFDVRKGNIDG